MFEVCIEAMTFETEKIVDNLKEARARFKKYFDTYGELTHCNFAGNINYYLKNNREFATKEKALSFIKKVVRETGEELRVNTELAKVKIFDDYSYLKVFRRSYTADKPITPAQWKHFLEGKRTVVEDLYVFTINEIHRTPCKMID